MSDFVILIVLTAALLHATWNAIVKGGRDKNLNMTAVVLGQALPALLVLPFVPSPTPYSWPWLVGGIALHVGYQVFLVRAYQSGDLTQVYPIARGSAPLLVTFVSIAFLGVTLTSANLLAIALLAMGVLNWSLCLRIIFVGTVK